MQTETQNCMRAWPPGPGSDFPRPAGNLAETVAVPALFSADGQYLAAFVVAAGRAGDMRRNGAATLRALAELRGLPAIGRPPRAQPHFRSFAFWDSHNDER